MTKQTFGPQPWLFPNPTVLVGTVVNGRPNVATYAWSGITGGEPPTISVGVRHVRYTLEGIMENRAFSVNIPSEDLVAAAWSNNRKTEQVIIDALTSTGVPLLDARVAAGAVMGALMAALLDWGEHEDAGTLGDRVRQALEMLGRGCV